jgi:hypothetical protein
MKLTAKMTICEGDRTAPHEEIIHTNASTCPLCDALEVIRDLKDEVSTISGELLDKTNQYVELEKEYKECPFCERS